MKIRVERKTILLLLAINVFVIAVQLLFFSAYRGWNGRELLYALAMSLIYADVTAIPAMLILPGILEKLATRKSLLYPAMILGPLFFLLAGCLAAQLLLRWTGLFEPDFWQWYVRTIPPALLGASLFGAGAFFYGSLQERLRKSEERMHQKEVLAAQAQKLAAEARLNSLAARLHPHFLFNTLNSISSLIIENPSLAEETVGRLATLLRSSLDNTSQPLIPLRQEMAMIRDYIAIEKVRFGEKLTSNIVVSEDLQEAKVPPLSILSLVENAVKHGINQQPGGGTLQVVASRQPEGSLLIEVRNSGPGFSLAAIPASHGLDNLVGRLNALFGEKARINVLQRDAWCVVQMMVPEL